MRHANDFYKPSEYPVVDGKLSNHCYLSALDNCYQAYCNKAPKQKQNVTLDRFDAFVFHSPECKLVAWWTLHNFLRNRKFDPKRYTGLENFANIELEKTYFDLDVEKAFLTFSKDYYETKTKP